MSEQVRNHLTANGYLRKRDIILGNFLGGLAWGLGSVLGASIIVAALLGILGSVNFVPGVGDITNQINHTVNSRIQK